MKPRIVKKPRGGNMKLRTVENLRVAKITPGAVELFRGVVDESRNRREPKGGQKETRNQGIPKGRKGKMKPGTVESLRGWQMKPGTVET
jgi:hypothetical protein